MKVLTHAARGYGYLPNKKRISAKTFEFGFRAIF